MFKFVVKYLGFLKELPLLPHVFDAMLKTNMMFANPLVLDYMDEIEQEMQQWPEISIASHKYGGIQFNYMGREIGHIHGNGLLDILFNKKMKGELLKQGRVKQHHIFKKSGWISFYISEEADKEYAIELLRQSIP